MGERLFIAQAKLESWLEEGKISFEDNVLTLLAEQVAYRLEPAVRVLSLLGGEDAAGLLGRTLTVAELTASGAEHYRDSLILGDTAYQCEEGFLGTTAAGATAVPPAVGSTASPSVVESTAPPPVVEESTAPPPAAASTASPPAAAAQPAGTAVRVAPPPPPAPARSKTQGTTPTPATASLGPSVTDPPAASQGAPDAQPDEAAAAAPGPDKSAKGEDFDLLVDFMLKHM